MCHQFRLFRISVPLTRRPTHSYPCVKWHCKHPQHGDKAKSPPSLDHRNWEDHVRKVRGMATLWPHCFPPPHAGIASHQDVPGPMVYPLGGGRWEELRVDIWLPQCGRMLPRTPLWKHLSGITGEFAYLDNWRSDWDREKGWGLHQPALRSWLTAFFLTMTPE